MSQIPDDLMYSKQHEWVRFEADGLATIGITDHAQRSLGDITYMDFPGVNTYLSQGESFGVIESVKAASDLYSPISGQVVEVNRELLQQFPEKINKFPYTEGWLIKLRPREFITQERENLLTPQDYSKIVQ